MALLKPFDAVKSGRNEFVFCHHFLEYLPTILEKNFKKFEIQL